MARLKSRALHRALLAQPLRHEESDLLSTRALVDLLQHQPADPRPLAHPRNWATAARSVRDYLLQAPSWWTLMGRMMNGYPKPFERITFKSIDGTRLSASIGRQAARAPGRRRGRAVAPREGILIVPGFFSTKDNILQRARALKMFQEWGYHVFAMDLRGFGESKRVHNTGGWKEAEDVIAAVQEFRRRVPVGTLHIYSESLGASAALIAAARVARHGERLIDGRLLAVSPYADLEQQVRFLSNRGERSNDFYMVQWFFLRLLRLGGNSYANFLEYAKAAAQSEDVGVDVLYELSSAKNFVAEVNVPTLILHSFDDPVVPATDADVFQKALENTQNPILWRLPWGSHCLYELMEPDWYWNLLRGFFDFACPLPADRA